MKKIFTLIVCLCMAFTLSACSQDHSEEEAKAVVNKYYTALNDGDWEKAEKLYTKDVDDGNELSSITSSMDKIDQSIDDMDLSSDQEKKLQDVITKFMKSSISQYAQSYKITKTKKNDDSTKVVVTVKVKGYDPNDFIKIDVNSFYSELSDKYQSKMLEEGSDIKELMVSMMCEVFDKYSEKVKELDVKTHKEHLTLVKKEKDNKATWKIKRIRVSASEEDTDA